MDPVSFLSGFVVGLPAGAICAGLGVWLANIIMRRIEKRYR